MQSMVWKGICFVLKDFSGVILIADRVLISAQG